VFEARWPVWDDSLIVEDDRDPGPGQRQDQVEDPYSAGRRETDAVAIALKDPTTARFVDNKALRRSCTFPIGC
jgi:hypothetical protein